MCYVIFAECAAAAAAAADVDAVLGKSGSYLGEHLRFALSLQSQNLLD